jgi:hypothetical protein
VKLCTRRNAAMVIVALTLARAPSGLAEGSKDPVGSWMLVSVKVEQRGQILEPFGPAPKGSLMFDRNGRYSLVIARSDLPKIASNNRSTGTPEEDEAIVKGSIASFGTYSVSETDRIIIMHVEGSTFPNWAGTDQKRIFSVTGDELKYTNSARSNGTGTALVIWKRVR